MCTNRNRLRLMNREMRQIREDDLVRFTDRLVQSLRRSKHKRADNIRK